MIVNLWSDLHQYAPKDEDFTFPGEMLLLAGDYCFHQSVEELLGCLEQVAKLNHKHKILTLGNHDPEHNLEKAFDYCLKNGIDLLVDSGVEVSGLKFWGYPWTPEFYDWSFMHPRGSEALQKSIDRIPDDVDVLISHGPAFGHLDKTYDGANVGCELLVKKIEKIKPKLFLCGHIHEAWGAKLLRWTDGSITTYCNASYGYKDEQNPPINLRLSEGEFSIL